MLLVDVVAGFSVVDFVSGAVGVAPKVDAEPKGEVVLLTEPKLDVEPNDGVVVLLIGAPKLDVEPNDGVVALLAPKLVVEPNKGVLELLSVAEPKLVGEPKAGAAVVVATELPNPVEDIFGADPKFEKDGMLPPAALAADPKLPKLPNPPTFGDDTVGDTLLPDKRSPNELVDFEPAAAPNAEKPEGVDGTVVLTTGAIEIDADEEGRASAL